MNNNHLRSLAYIIIVSAVITGFYFVFNNKKNSDTSGNDLNRQDQTLSGAAESTTVTAEKKTIITEPIAGALARITKKPFGIKVSPAASPVTPEKFSGYHTGVDFETSDSEQNIDIPVYAICAGQLSFKGYASGYGSVAIQSCQIAGEAVTVIYGHLKFSSIELAKKAELLAGQKIGILGKGYSPETDGERKHLHLGIHKGSVINIRGYVAKQSELEAWIDGAKYL